MSATETPLYRFAEFELDPLERRLTGHGKPITLAPKVFDTLVLLVERGGRAIGKDELMTALWPRGFVDESNLTKHIWLIRKALGEKEHAARFIETVPKFGYRFVEPVVPGERAATHVIEPISLPLSGSQSSPELADELAATSAASPVAVAPSLSRESLALAQPLATHTLADSGSHRGIVDSASPPLLLRISSRRLRIVAFVAALLLIAAAIGLWRYMPQETTVVSGNSSGTALAIVEFNNLSQNAKDAWLAPALAEMLGTEIALGGRLQMLPDELVRPARSDLAAPLAGGYALQSLATLRKRLGADYVLSGSYLVTGTSDEPKLKLDLALQETRSGIAVANVSRFGPVAELTGLVTQAAAALRDNLGIGAADSADLARAANAQPPTAEIARRVGFALDALHRYDPARARDELLDAVAQAPGYAPTYAYLAQAWSALGYKSKALAAAQQAMTLLKNLPDEESLSIEAELYSAQFNWPKATEALRKLVALQPRNPEPQLRLIEALLDGSQPDAADTLLATLRKLPGMQDDPRVELAAARAANAHADPKGRAAHAEIALKQAQARDNLGLAAQAREELGVAYHDLGQYDQAEALHRQNITYFQHTGNPHGEAFSHEALANALSDAGRIDPAREEYQRSLGLYQQIGDLNGQASSYDNISTVLWGAGDADGALRAVGKALELVRETGDLNRQAWNLNALASMQSDTAASDEVAAHFREAIALARQAGRPTVWYLAAYAGFFEVRGDLDDARAQCVQAQTEAAPQSDRQLFAYAESQCAAIALDGGDVDGAIAGYQRSQAAARDIEDHYFDAVASLALGQIEIGRKRWPAAHEFLQQAIDAFATAADAGGEANAQGLIALAYAALEKHTERDQAAARARELRARINQHQQVFVVDLALAQLRGQRDERAEALASLRQMAIDAENREWVSLALEAKLAALDLLPPADAAAASLRSEIEAEATRHGFKWVLTRLRRSMGSEEVGAPSGT